ncbi:MAG: glycosyltransferase [Solirubrobacteraceae bacterium]
MRPPAVSIIVAVLDEALVIRETAAAIRGQDFVGPMELLFVDGMSGDGTRKLLAEIATEDDRVRVVDNPDRSQVAALNLGLRHARGDVIVQMDAHALYPGHYVSAAVERLQRGDTDWVTGPPVPYGTDRCSRRVAAALGSRFGTGGSDKWHVGDGEIELDSGVFGGVWRRDTLERLGGWDERWPVNHDSELAARYLRGDGRIVCMATLATRYIPRGSLRSLALQYGRYGAYRARTAQHHPETLRPSHLLAAGPAPVLLAATKGPLRRPARALLALYVMLAVGESIHLGARRGAREVAALTAVFATMHFGWAFGFLAGCARFGVPLRGFVTAVRSARLPFRAQ